MRHFTHKEELTVEDLKIGDKVKVVRRLEKSEWGDSYSWLKIMDSAIGGVYEIANIHRDVVQLRDGLGSWWYRICTLERE